MPSSGAKRRLTAILAADVVGYSRLMGEDETGTLERLKSVRREIVQPAITDCSGRIVKLMGDGLLAEFPSVVEAVQCAVTIQESMDSRDTDLGEDQRIRLRIGVNLGDILVEGSDIYGDGVNVAARLEGLADAGGICISDTVRSAIGKKLDMDYEDMGEQVVKNISEPIRAYKVLLANKNSAVVNPVKAEYELPDKPSIAVLPFTNMSGDPEQEYFSDGICEDIITQLSNFSGLFVIARNSCFVYKGQSIDVKAVARELGVRYILEGSVRRAGSRLRVTAQLLDSKTATHVWAERYDGNIIDVFDLQDEISRDIVGSIAPQIELAELERGRKLRSEQLTSYELSLKSHAMAHDAIRAGDSDALQYSIETAQKALDIDDRNIRALWTQAFGYMYSYLQRWGDDPNRTLDLLLSTSEMLVQVDSSYPNAYVARAVAQQFLGNFDAAIANYHRALDLNPNNALTLFMAAWSEALAGLTEEAKEHAQLALRLSPKDLDVWLGCAYLALLEASFAEQDFEAAKKWGQLAVQMHSTAPIRRALMIASCAYTGDFAGATTHIEALNSFSPKFASAILLGELKLYKQDEHNQLLTDGLRNAGLCA